MKKQTLIVFASIFILEVFSKKNSPKEPDCLFGKNSAGKCLYEPNECPYNKKGKCKIKSDPDYYKEMCGLIMCTQQACAYGEDPRYCGCCFNSGCLPEPGKERKKWVKQSRCPDLDFKKLGLD
ncbi:unnamed protein product [Cunninghamella echinulata]